MVNEYSTLINYGDSFHYYIYELANFSFIAFIVLFAYKLKWISSLSMWAWLFFSLIPLLGNYFLFSPGLFGDQFTYFEELTALKTTGESVDYIKAAQAGGQISEVTIAAKMLGFVPLPTYMTVTSLSFANKFISFFLFLWLLRFFDEKRLLLIFLIPSFLLFSSIALRDFLVISFSILSLLHLVRGKYFFGILFLVPLIYIKLQMFAFIFIYLLGRLIFQAHKSFAGMLLMFISGLIALFIYQDLFLQVINYYKVGFVAENFEGGYRGWGKFGDASLIEISSIFEFIWQGLINLPVFILMPLPWQWGGPLGMLQFFESVGLILALFYLVKKYYQAHDQELIFLLACLGIGLLVYSFLAENIGTFVRYRFTLFLPFLIAFYYVANRNYNSSKTERR